MEVIAVTANSGYDANTGEQAEDEDRELPGTVTLLVSPEQSRVLAELEADGKLHLSLVYRGTKENAARFTQAQDALLEELYAPEEEETEDGEKGTGGEGSAAEAGSEDTENGPEDTAQAQQETEKTGDADGGGEASSKENGEE